MNCYNVTSAAPNNIYGVQVGSFVDHQVLGRFLFLLAHLGGSYVRRMTSTEDGRLVKIISLAKIIIYNYYNYIIFIFLRIIFYYVCQPTCKLPYII